MISNYLTFSDAAKFADIARNFILGHGYVNSFNFWSNSIFQYLSNQNNNAFGILPIMPISISVFFKLFGISDFSVVATSFFYFILTLIFAYLLGKKIFNSKLIGIMSVLSVGLNYDLIHYAINGASESPFIFEILAGLYFATLKKRWADIIAVVFMFMMYFTRNQSFIYILGIIFYLMLLNLNLKKAVYVFGIIIIAGIFVDRMLILPIIGNNFFYSVTNKGISVANSQTVSISTSDNLRGGGASFSPYFSIIQVSKNIFYNLYNFYKALPEIINPYFFTIFTLGLFIRSKNNIEKSFKLTTGFMLLATFIVAAASIPFYRYLHPVIPLVYILATGTLVEILNKSQITSSKQTTINKLQIPKRISLFLGSCLLVLLFGVGQTLGRFLLDSRFEKNTHNVGKPPVYVELSKVLKENTNSDDVVVTNLDTWGSWYGERKTVWFPLTPKQLIDPNTGNIPFDVIYLTSYKIDDANYYMGKDWRMIFENPENPNKWTCEGCPEVAKVFKLKRLDIISSVNNYEKHDGAAVLLVKK